jgi:hypothetical protein
MKYMLLIYGSEAVEAAKSEAVRQAEMAEYFGLNDYAKGRNISISSAEALLPTQMATSVRLRNNQIGTTDGPFAETKEQLAGYYVIECQNLDEAIDFAAHIPGSRDGVVEIRPVVVFS